MGALLPAVVPSSSTGSIHDSLDRVRGLARVARRVDLFPYESHPLEEARRLVRPMIERLLLVGLDDVAQLQAAVVEDATPDPDDWLFDGGEEGQVAEDPRQRELIDLCEMIRLDLSQRLELLRGDDAAELWEFLTVCNHARGALIKAAVSLEAAVCTRVRLPTQLDAMHEVASALRVRAGYRLLQQALAAGGDPDRERIGERLATAAQAVESLVASALFVELRVADRCQLRRVTERLDSWLAGGANADPDAGIRLWQDLSGLAAMMQLVNNRQDLLAHDRALLLEALGQLYGSVPAGSRPGSPAARTPGRGDGTRRRARRAPRDRRATRIGGLPARRHARGGAARAARGPADRHRLLTGPSPVAAAGGGCFDQSSWLPRALCGIR